MNISQIILGLLGPIALCVAVLIIYVFFIWYRDWLGKNTFSLSFVDVANELDINIYLAKATTILLFVLGLVALQLLLFPVEGQVLQWMVPTEFRTDLSIYEITKVELFKYIFPTALLLNLFFIMVAGMIAVFIVFTAILFERSFRLKGIIYGILYCAASFLSF